MQSLEHHHAWHDGKTGEMVAKVLFVGGQRALADQPLAGFEECDAIELTVFHVRIILIYPKPLNRRCQPNFAFI